MMRHVCKMAMAACCLLLASILLAQDVAPTKAGAPATATTGGPGVTVVTTFPGDSGPGPRELPENSGAVGPDRVVDFTNANFVIHDKKTGKVVQKSTQAEFWKAVKPGLDLPKMSNPRMLYDALSGRWFAVMDDGPKGASVGYLAVSETSDPAKGWKGVKLPMPPSDPSAKIGVDKNGFYVSYHVVSKDTKVTTSVQAIPKADAIAADGPSLANLQTFDGLDMDAFPATDPDPDKPADAPAILLHHEFGQEEFSNMMMYKITWTGDKAAISQLQTIPLGRKYSANNGISMKNQATQPAPGPMLRADMSRRTPCVFQHAGSVFTCNEAKRSVDSRCGIFWCEVRVSDGALLQEGLIDDPNCDYLVPSLAVDAKGNVGIGCTMTSEKEFPSVAVMMRAAGDPKNTMRPPVIAAKGTAVYSSGKAGKYGVAWGNYNATCLDPSDPMTIWTYQQYAASAVADQWTTCWAAFKLK